MWLAWWVGCALDPALVEAPVAARTGLVLSLGSTLEAGETATFVVTGAAPGAPVKLLRGAGLGNGACPAKLGGLCLGLTGQPAIVGSAVADADGRASFAVVVPNAASLAVQAVVPAGAASLATEARADPIGAPVARATPTHGASVVVSPDERFAVVAHRSAGELGVVSLDLAGATGASVGRWAAEEPYAAVLSDDGDTAFVVLRDAGQVARINAISSGAPILDPLRADVGAEPSGIAYAAGGGALYVANRADGTVSVVDPRSLGVVHTVDLNAALVATGALGTVAPRGGLAHPHAIVVTDDGDGDDDDETVYATEFFSQADPAASYAALGDAWFDVGRMGIVYAFDVATRTVRTIPLAAIPDTGFADSLGQPTGCFPNQLNAAAIDDGHLYVTGMCASPRGPQTGGGVNAKTKVHPTLYAIDLATDAEAPPVVLTRALEDAYVAAGVADDGSRRFPLLPSGLAFDDAHVPWIPALGADALFAGADPAFVNLHDAPFGRLPSGVALTSAHALVLNEHTRNLQIVDRGARAVVGAIEAATPVDPSDPAAVAASRGELFFTTGLDRWSLNGQAWGSCAGCHPEGWTDGVTWFFPAGPRQTISLESTFGPSGEQRLLTWTARFDEVGDEETNTREFSGGVGAIVHEAVFPFTDDQRIAWYGPTPGAWSPDTSQRDLDGSVNELHAIGVPGTDPTGAPVTVSSVLADWLEVEAWVATVRAPNPPSNLDPDDVAAGEALFVGAGCHGCHGLENWTISERFYEPSQAVNGPGGLLETTTFDLGALPAALHPQAAGGPLPLRSDGTVSCALRTVGTFPQVGLARREVREDMVSPADGATGYNVPSLLSIAAGAPFFHAGNARTLEEALDPAFAAHHQAFAPGFAPTARQRRQLAAYVASIGADTPTHDPASVGFDPVLCPAVL